jgi:hypothetical protein
VVNVPIAATFQPTDVMVVEWAYEMSGPGTYFGGNPAPQTGPTYIRSVSCAVPEPLDLAAIGFPDSHWALTVNGAGAPPVVTATGTSGTVAPGASAQIAVTADATGLTPGTYNFSLEVETNDPGNANVSVPITVNVSSGGPNTYPSTDTPIAIPDNLPSGITSTIVIPALGGLEVVDLDVDMNVTHTWVGDLLMTLTKDATTVAIFDQPGVPATTFGCSGDNINIVMDDEGTDGSVDGSCTSATPAYPVPDGHYTPDNPLSAFDGINVPGSWVLHVSDNAGGDTGTVELTVPTSQDVRVAVYDMLGREVMVLFEGSLDASQRALVSVAAGRLNAGSYVVRATGESFEMIQRVTVAR